ncbi:hypothetical protein [Actinomycetospora soli]|uniref:hypothetical protein n=1 Tax=Actinomycetospora soli TaxID=2893887 RepID=UPI001E5CEC4D|nr:hypothetical protein [Actinomycetospora soli]MCD2186123.1 hypothetical protein [Actinomycetospora soli]
MNAPTGPVAPAVPSTIRTAVLLWTVALALYLVGQVLAVLLPPTAEDYAAYFRSLDLPADPQFLATVEDASGTASVVGLAVTVVVVALFAWVGLKVRAGAHRARTATAILAALGALGALATGGTALVSPVPAAAGGFGTVLQVVSGLVLIAYLVFLFRRPSSEYFAARR